MRLHRSPQLIWIKVVFTNTLDCRRLVVYNQGFRSDVLTLRAEVAELADAQASGACGRKVVEVQILSSAPPLKSLGNAVGSGRLTA